MTNYKNYHHFNVLHELWPQGFLAPEHSHPSVFRALCPFMRFMPVSKSGVNQDRQCVFLRYK